MYLALKIVSAVSAGIMIVAILLQNRGSGLGSTFGGDSNVYRTKRGMEKVLLIITIACAFLFFGSLLAGIVVPR